jgi:hypothetical protein
MRNLMFLPCAALLTAAAPAASAPPAVASQIAPSDTQQAMGPSGGGAAPRAEDKKICKQLETSGSRLPRRACLTQKEWKQVDAELEQ